MQIKDLKAYLASQSKEELLALLLRQLAVDSALRQSLTLVAARTLPKGSKVSALQRAFDAAMAGAEDVGYREMPEFCSGIEEAIDAIEGLLPNHAEAVIGLAEYGLKQLEEALGTVDDSDGELGELIQRLQEMHLRACCQAKPEPEALAQRLFEWELSGDWDVFHGAAETYAAILGKKGLAIYQSLADAAWAKVPALGPGGSNDERWGKRFHITQIQLSLARGCKGIDATVAVMSRDLSSAYNYLQIADLCKREGRHDQALDWAERGVKAFPKKTDSRLRHFLADEYSRCKRHAEALALVWVEFTESPQLGSYQSLKLTASKAGEWEVWREKALNRLRASAAQRSELSRTMGYGGPSSELVRIHLWEKDPDVAWAQAKAGGCTDSLWLELAAKREAIHPAEAVPIYQRQAEAELGQRNNDAYRRALGHVNKIQKLLEGLGRTTEFKAYVAVLRKDHKPKRNFMKLLDRKWPAA